MPPGRRDQRGAIGGDAERARAAASSITLRRSAASAIFEKRAHQRKAVNNLLPVIHGPRQQASGANRIIVRPDVYCLSEGRSGWPRHGRASQGIFPSRSPDAVMGRR
jgi:hypothetical protein